MSDVLFVQDSQDNFDDLETKDQNTIYAINASGDFSNTSPDGEGKLYVGKHQVSGFPTNFNNPVSPSSLMPTAYQLIVANSIVFKGIDGMLYSITGNSKVIMDPNWGLALCTELVQANNRPLAENLLQQGYYAKLDWNTFTNNAPLVLVCIKNGNQYTTLGVVKEFSQLTDFDEAFIYIGTAVNTTGKVGVALDFSNHNFYSRSNGYISAINGTGIVSPTKWIEKVSGFQSGVPTGEFANMTNLSSKRRVFFTSINTPGVYRIYANLSIKTNFTKIDETQPQIVDIGLFGGFDTTPEYKEQAPIFATKITFYTLNQVISVALEQFVVVTAADLALGKSLFIGYGLQTSVSTVDILAYDTVCECPLSHFGVALISKATDFASFVANDFEDDNFII